MTVLINHERQISSDSPSQPTGRRSPLVLVVDDHEDTRMLLRFILESHGWRVSEAADGEACLFLTGLMKPDLILMDTTLPKVDGLTATRTIRSVPETSHIPIIFISGHALPEARLGALAAGGNEYFLKPINIEELESAVEFHLNRESVGGH